MIHKNYYILRKRARKRVLQKTIIKIPKLDRELINAIRLIGPHLLIGTDEQSRLFLEQDQNLTCLAEHKVLKPYLQSVAVPNRVLELGPGIGRSIIYFKNALGWKDSYFVLYDATNSKTNYSVLGKRADDTFCGNIQILKRILEYNKITRYQICDAREYSFNLSKLNGPYDLIYSFYAIGFHWSLEYFFDDILSLMKKGGLGFFTVPDTFVGFPNLNRMKHEIRTENVYYPSKTMSILIIQKE